MGTTRCSECKHYIDLDYFENKGLVEIIRKDFPGIKHFCKREFKEIPNAVMFFAEIPKWCSLMKEGER